MQMTSPVWKDIIGYHRISHANSFNITQSLAPSRNPRTQLQVFLHVFHCFAALCPAWSCQRSAGEFAAGWSDQTSRASPRAPHAFWHKHTSLPAGTSSNAWWFKPVTCLSSNEIDILRGQINTGLRTLEASSSVWKQMGRKCKALTKAAGILTLTTISPAIKGAEPQYRNCARKMCMELMCIWYIIAYWFIRLLFFYIHMLEAYQRPRGRGTKARWARRDVYWENMWCDLLLSFRELKIGKKSSCQIHAPLIHQKNVMWQPRYIHPSSKKCLGILRCAPPFLAKIGSSHVFAQAPWGKKSARIQVVILSVQSLRCITLQYLTLR